MNYTDLELLAQESPVVRENGKILLPFSLTAVKVLGPIKCELDLRTLRQLKDAATAPEATWKEASALGEALSSVLLPAAIFNVISDRINIATAQNKGLRIRLILSGAELNNVPWEFLLFNRAGGESKASDFLCLMPNVSLVRHPASTLPEWGVEATSTVKVTIAAAGPAHWPKLKVSEEVALIKKALEGNSQVSISTVEHAQRTGMPDKTHPAHIFHFAGHGKFERRQSATPGAYEGTSSLILENEYGEEDVLDAGILALQLREAGVRVAVLGACQTAQRDDINSWSSVAESLLKAELGAVVGMQFPVRDDSATAFAEHFYGALALGLSIDEAVSAGRIALATLDDARGWANPSLYLRADNGVIFPDIAADPQLATARQQAVLKVVQQFKTVRGIVRAGTIEGIAIGANVTIEQTAEEVAEGGVVEGPTVGKIGFD
ncbi:MAG TPA: CHAT domain-containing protein [Pyrinomonadaceae bacterium]|nr:CHAT domain-containing protein [Pyrinomonadaceae bacterium]